MHLIIIIIIIRDVKQEIARCLRCLFYVRPCISTHDIQLCCVMYNVIQCTDGSQHFAAFGIACCIRRQEAWDPDRSLLGSNVPHCMVNIFHCYCVCFSLLWLRAVAAEKLVLKLTALVLGKPEWCQHTRLFNSCLSVTARVSRCQNSQEHWPNISSLLSSNSLKALPAFSYSPCNLPLGADSKENLRKTAEHSMKNLRTESTFFILA